VGPPVAPLQRPARREDPRQTTLRAHSHMMHRCKGLIAGTVLSIMRAAACAQLRRRSTREWDAPRDVLGRGGLSFPLSFSHCPLAKRTQSEAVKAKPLTGRDNFCERRSKRGNMIYVENSDLPFFLLSFRNAPIPLARPPPSGTPNFSVASGSASLRQS
jgi:hypothetical protein